MDTIPGGRPARPRVVMIIPCFNEEEVLPLLRDRLIGALTPLAVDWSVLFVDDGSRDGTPVILASLHTSDPRFMVVGLSRNFGHQTAVSAGIRHLTPDADVVCILDADLQDPPRTSRWLPFHVERRCRRGLRGSSSQEVGSSSPRSVFCLLQAPPPVRGRRYAA